MSNEHYQVEVYPDPDEPRATVIHCNHHPALYVYPSIYPDGWSYVSTIIPHECDFGSRAEAWQDAMTVLKHAGGDMGLAIWAALEREARPEPFRGIAETDE